MKLSFQSYLLVSLVSLVHVVVLAMLLPTRQGGAPSRSSSAVFIDDEGLAWIGPAIGGDPETHDSPENGLDGIRPEDGNRTSGRDLEGAEEAPGPAASLAPPLDAPARRRDDGGGAYDSVAASDRSDAGESGDGASEPAEAAALPQPFRELRPLNPSAVN